MGMKQPKIPVTVVSLRVKVTRTMTMAMTRRQVRRRTHLKLKPKRKPRQKLRQRGRLRPKPKPSLSLNLRLPRSPRDVEESSKMILLDMMLQKLRLLKMMDPRKMRLRSPRRKNVCARQRPVRARKLNLLLHLTLLILLNLNGKLVVAKLVSQTRVKVM